jgi:hypothetical protein
MRAKQQSHANVCRVAKIIKLKADSNSKDKNVIKKREMIF